MAKVATRSLPRYALAAGIIALLALGLLYLRGELILWKINTLESSVEGFVGTPSCEPPSWVPENVSYVINSGLWEVTRSYHGAEGLTRRVWLTLGSGYSELYLTNIVYLHPGFEEVLGRFSNLTGVTVWFSYDSSSLSEQDARKVCEVLRTMPRLEWVELKGPHLPLPACPGVRRPAS